MRLAIDGAPMTPMTKPKRLFSIRRDPSKALQWGFTALLLICAGQAAYWVGDNLMYTQAVEERLSALYASLDDSTLQEVLPGQLSAAAAIGEVAELSAARTNRYLWEGAFFLLVLSASIFVLVRAIRHEAELRRRQQNFLAAVSHELKSPLAGIQLSAETLMHRQTTADAPKLGYRILSESRRLLRMIDNLLNTTRLEEGRWELRAATENVADTVEAAITRVDEVLKRHGLSVSKNIDQSHRVLIDTAVFAIVIDNLIDNSIKSCIAAGGQGLSITSQQRKGMTEITITDDGIGFPEADAELIFDKFYRPGDELRRKTPGSGLGLYLVRQLVERSGGKVSGCNNLDSRGATFTLQLPAV